MGKIRTRVLGNEEEEKKQKEEQKKKAQEKKGKNSSVIANEEKQSSSNEVATSPDEEAPRNDKTEKKAKKAAPKESKASTNKHGKKYLAVQKTLEKGKFYTVSEAVSQLKKATYAKFDESVEVHINVEKTGLKGEVELPHSTGKTVRVVVVTDDLLKELEDGVINFDVLVTHPSYMPKLARFAKLLGPKGLMPNPKSGTISDKPEDLVKKFSGGALRWKTEPKFPLIHQMVGKASFDEKQLTENITLVLKSVGKANIISAYLTTTMGPGLKLSVENL